jgi:16S rRNA (uracil1498-N3)-methyltransferase
VRRHRARVEVLEGQVRLSPAESAHLRVLRAAPGDAITVFDGQGREADAVITAIDPAGVLLEVGPSRPLSRELPQPVTMAVALLKGDKWSDVVRAATELGAATFQPLVTRRCDVKEAGTGKLQRWQRIAGEAAKQCGRAFTPQVLEPIALDRLPVVSCGLVAQPGSALRPREAVIWDGPVWLATGPEGGFTDEEVAALAERGFAAVGLGPRILRAETAPLALLAALGAGEGV